jgi:hypothetical protein
VLLGGAVGAVFAFTGGSSTPDDASEDEFCEAATGVLGRALEAYDPDLSKEEQADKAYELLQD